tara:strand:- start:74 stop:964 length:891 start_codon:yes stop_codon:yes gene_type:complete
MAMGLDLVAVMRKLGVSLDTDSPPITSPGVITWLGRIFDVTPEHSQQGLIEGMEVWTSGQGFAPLDLVGIESWLFDAPRGDHLIIAERKMTFEVKDSPSREGRMLSIWPQEKLAAFIGHAVLDGSLVIVEQLEVEEKSELVELFSGKGPFTLKPLNDFSALENKGYDVSMAKPVLIPAILYRVTGVLKGPVDEEIIRWVLNCDGLHVIDNVELLERSPMLNHENLVIVENPSFAEVLSERRAFSDGMGDLLRWWKFEEESANSVEYNVLVPAHKGADSLGEKWVLNGVTGKIHSNF